MKKAIITVIVLVLIVALGVGGYFIYVGSQKNKDPIDDVAAKTLIQQARQTVPLPSNAVTGLSKAVDNTYSVEEITTLQTAEVKAVRTALQQAGISLNPTAGYNTSYEKVVAATTLSDLDLWGTDDVIFWPGAIIRVVDPTKNDSPLTSFGLPTGTVTLSTSMYTATGTNSSAATPRVVENATLASVRQAINGVVNDYLTQGSNHGSKFSAEISEVKSREDLELFSLTTSTDSPARVMADRLPQSEKTIVQNQFGEDIGNISTGSGGSSSTASDTTFIRISLKQIFYTVDVNNVNNPSEIFDPSVTQAQLASALATGGIPAYVSSVSYGMRAEIFIETSMSFTEFKNENSLSKSIYDLNKESEIAETLEALTELYKDGSSAETVIKNMDCFIYGGSGLSGSAFYKTSDAGEVMDAFDTVSSDPTKWVGAPLSFQIRHIDGSNSLIQIGKANEYYRRVLTPIPVESLMFTADQKSEINAARSGGERVLLSVTKSPGTATLYESAFALAGINGMPSNKFTVNNTNPRLSLLIDTSSSITIAEIRAEDVFEGGANVTKYYLTIFDNAIARSDYLGEQLVIRASAGGKEVTHAFAIISAFWATIEFDTRGGTVVGEQMINLGTYLPQPTPPTKADGSFFGGWYTSTAFTSATRFDFSKPINADTVLYARWLTEEPVIIEFVTNTTEIMDIIDNSFAQGEMVLFPHLTNKGYSLEGWYKDSTFKTKWNVATDRAENMSLHAKWVVIDYEIIYNLGGGTNHASNPDSYTVNDNVVLQNPTRDGYTFEGWMEGNGIPVGSIGGRVFTATWNIITYDVTYNLSGGTNDEGNPDNYTTEDATITLQDPTKAGYAFDGWSEGDSITSGSTGEKTFTAIWSIITYNITYGLNSGTLEGVNQATYTVNDMFTLINPIREGYAFIGWSGTNIDGREMTVFIDLGSTEDRSYIANWEIEKYSISYNLDNGMASGNITSYTIDSDSFTLKTPTRSEYIFAGWSGTGINEPVATVTVNKGSTGNKNYTANWTKIKSDIVTMTWSAEIYGAGNNQSDARKIGNATFTIYGTKVRYNGKYYIYGNAFYSGKPGTSRINDVNEITLRNCSTNVLWGGVIHWAGSQGDNNEAGIAGWDKYRFALNSKNVGYHCEDHLDDFPANEQVVISITGICVQLSDENAIDTTIPEVATTTVAANLYCESTDKGRLTFEVTGIRVKYGNDYYISGIAYYSGTPQPNGTRFNDSDSFWLKNPSTDILYGGTMIWRGRWRQNIESGIAGWEYNSGKDVRYMSEDPGKDFAANETNYIVISGICVKIPYAGGYDNTATPIISNTSFSVDAYSDEKSVLFGTITLNIIGIKVWYEGKPYILGQANYGGTPTRGVRDNDVHAMYWRNSSKKILFGGTLVWGSQPWGNNERGAAGWNCNNGAGGYNANVIRFIMEDPGKDLNAAAVTVFSLSGICISIDP